MFSQGSQVLQSVYKRLEEGFVDTARGTQEGRGGVEGSQGRARGGGGLALVGPRGFRL